MARPLTLLSTGTQSIGPILRSIEAWPALALMPTIRKLELDLLHGNTFLNALARSKVTTPGMTLQAELGFS